MARDEQRWSGLPHTRPEHWDELYGPHGQPPDFTPPGTAMNSVQSPTGLRLLSVIMCIFAAGFLWFLGYGINTRSFGAESYTLCAVMALLSISMAVWGFRLADKRARWIREKKQESGRKSGAS